MKNVFEEQSQLTNEQNPKIAEEQIDIDNEILTGETPEVFDLEGVLSEADSYYTQASQTQEETEEAVAKYDAAQERLPKVDKSLTQRVEAINRARGFDYNVSDPDSFKELLVIENVDGEEIEVFNGQKAAEQVLKLNDLIKKFEGLKDDNKSREILEKLLKAKAEAESKISELIEKESELFEERKEGLRNMAYGIYDKKITDLEAIISEVKANPKALEFIENREKEAQEKLAQEQKELQEKTFEEMKRCFQSVSGSHQSSFANFEKILPDFHKRFEDAIKIAEEVASQETVKNPEAEYEEVLRREAGMLRRSFVSAFEQKKPEEEKPDKKGDFLPWCRSNFRIRRYNANLDFLRNFRNIDIVAGIGDAKADELLDGVNQVIKENETLFRVAGLKFIKDRLTGKEFIGDFHSLFLTTQDQEKNVQIIQGINKARKEDVNRKRLEFIRKEAEEKRKRPDGIVYRSNDSKPQVNAATRNKIKQVMNKKG